MTIGTATTFVLAGKGTVTVFWPTCFSLPLICTKAYWFAAITSTWASVAPGVAVI